MSKRSLYIFIILLSEIIVLSICGYYIFRALQKQKGQTNVIALDRQNLLLHHVSGLTQFYEPIPNTTRKDTITWLHGTKKQAINSDSINSEIDFAIEKKAGTYRIITLGDSFTYGLYVNTNENWPERLSRKLNQTLQCPTITAVEVINLGFPGYDIQHALYRYKIRGVKYDPDAVIWLLKDDDFIQFAEISNLSADQKTAITSYISEEERVNDYIKQLLQSAKDIERVYSPKEVETIQHQLFTEFSNLFSGILFLTTMSNTSDVYKRRMQEWGNARPNTIAVDTPIRLLETDVYPDTHPNENGHQKIADHMYEVLTQTVFAICTKKIIQAPLTTSVNSEQ